MNIVIGYHNNWANEWFAEYINRWNNLENNLFQRKLTNLLTEHIENWGMSPALLAKLKKENLELFKNLLLKRANNYLPNHNDEFNIFECDK